VTFKRFDVLVVPFPFTDSATVKRRPALVLSVEAFNDRAGHLVLDRAILQSFAKFALTGVILGAALWFAARFAAVHLAQISAFRDEAALLILVVVGAVVYAGSILALFGRRWLVSLVR